MILCWWNVRGLNDPLKVREVKRLLNKQCVYVCGLFETRVKEKNLNLKTTCFGHNWTWTTNYSSNRKGRIWVGWQPDYVDCYILYSDTQIIHCRLRDKSSLDDMVVSFVYGLHTISDRRTLWPPLIDLAATISVPWDQQI